MQRRFYIQVTIVLISAMCFSSLYYYSVCDGLRKTRESFPGKLSYILYDSTHYEAVFFGSSRVSRNINPMEFAQKSGLSAYNAGIDGAGYATTDMLARKFMQRRGMAKYVFINLDTYTLAKDSSLFYYTMFYPHLADPDLYDLARIEPTLRLGRNAPFLAVSYIDDYLKGVAADSYFGIWPEGDTVFDCKGFEPIDSKEFKGSADTFTLSYHYDTVNLKSLDTLCQYFDRNGSKVFFIMAPIWGAIDHRTENATNYYAQLHSIASKHGVTELNYYTDARFTKDKFYNHTHLNHVGADLYSKLLADTICRIRSGYKP